jgi:hypothetical protein
VCCVRKPTAPSPKKKTARLGNSRAKPLGARRGVSAHSSTRKRMSRACRVGVAQSEARAAEPSRLTAEREAMLSLSLGW